MRQVGNEKGIPMPKAVWNGTVIADSEKTVVVEGNHYFPADSLLQDHFQQSDTTTVCGWKGTARYYDVVVDGQVNAGAAWYYAEPKPEAENIRDRVAFWKGIEIQV